MIQNRILIRLKGIVASCLVSSLLFTSNCITNIVYTYGQEYTESTEEKIEQTSLDSQLNKLYDSIGNQLNIDSRYVKILHVLAGGQAVYADKKPNIYIDETVKTVRAPFEINGTNTEYKKFELIECDDETIERPSKYYLPDAAYSVTSDIVKIMNDRASYDRQDAQIYFDSLTQESKIQILFYEAVMQYMNQPIESINSFYRIYEKLLFDKEYEENVLEIQNDFLSFKPKFKQTFIENGITTIDALNALAVIASFDTKLAISDNSDSIKKQYVMPYQPNYTSRENMMLAAMSLIGKVRYVWGGGHSGASSIDGINPIWKQFEELYGESQTVLMPIKSESTEEIAYTEVINPGYNKCIKPSGSWCPIHGESQTDCSFNGPIITNIDEYLDTMSKYIDTSSIDRDKYKDLMKTLDFNLNTTEQKGISIDTLNGLDCSGYCSWVYNQVTNRYNINYTANYFADSTGVIELPFGSQLYPGDVFAWKTHIVLIIGRTSDSNLVYITSESTPNVIRFGVVYYTGASKAEIAGAKEIARQANELIGGLGSNEQPHVYCMNTAGLYKEYTDSEGNIITKEEYNNLQNEPRLIEGDTEETTNNTEETTNNTEETTNNTEGDIIEKLSPDDIPMALEITAGEINTYNYCKIGRLKDQFIDEETVIAEYNKQFKNMYADEIIQYVLTKLNYSYVTGYNTYTGDIFDKEMVASSLIYK